MLIYACSDLMAGDLRSVFKVQSSPSNPSSFIAFWDP